MNVININGFSFEGNLKVLNDPVRVKDVTPQLQDKEISVKLDISKEGIRHVFHGEPELSVELPDDYQSRIEEMLGKTAEEFTNKYSNISDVSEAQMITDAKAIASRILREDKEFYESMKILFGGNGR